MKTHYRLLTIFAALLLCAQVANATSQLNVIIMGVDHDVDSVPIGTRAYKEVVNSLSEQLNRNGFSVTDDFSLRQNIAGHTSMRRTDSELINIAKQAKSPIDIALLFTVYAYINKTEYTNKVSTNVSARLVQISNGERLGNFQLKSPPSWTAKVKCDRICVHETLGEYSKILAQDIGAILTEQLSYIASQGLVQQYHIAIKNVAPQALIHFKQQLAEMPHAEEVLAQNQSSIIYKTKMPRQQFQKAVSDIAQLNFGNDELQVTTEFRNFNIIIKKEQANTHNVIAPQPIEDTDW